MSGCWNIRTVSTCIKLLPDYTIRRTEQNTEQLVKRAPMRICFSNLSWSIPLQWLSPSAHSENACISVEWRHNERDGVSNHPRLDQSSAPLAFVREIHRWPVNSMYKRPVTRKMLPFDDDIMILRDFFGHSIWHHLIIVYSKLQKNDA